MARRLIIPLFALALAVPAVHAAEPKLEDEQDKTIYAIGMVLSRYITQFNLTDDEYDLVAAGLKAGARGDTSKVDVNEYTARIQEFEKQRSAAAAAGEADQAAAFLAKMRGEKGATITDSGLIYIETKAGDGASPSASDTVSVHYHGTLRDGTVFDSSVDRGQPASFGLNRVIPCWTEGVQMMKVGGKATLVCPSDIAYGDRGAGGKIKPGAALKFDVELLSID